MEFLREPIADLLVDSKSLRDLCLANLLALALIFGFPFPYLAMYSVFSCSISWCLLSTLLDWSTYNLSVKGLLAKESGVLFLDWHNYGSNVQSSRSSGSVYLILSILASLFC